MMQELLINVALVDEWQMLHNMVALDNLFLKATRTIIGGQNVILIRKHPEGLIERFDIITNEEDLVEYKKRVYKYL
jgi:hypothetical protein